MSEFHKQLRAFAVEEIGKPGKHKRREIAERFLDAFPDLAASHLQGLASDHIAKLIKAMCDEATADPLPLFCGFPAAIVIAPGVVKATANCTLDDLGAGLSYREENVRNARDRLEAYGKSMTAFVALRVREDETVGECEKRVREENPHLAAQVTIPQQRQEEPLFELEPTA